MKKTAKKENIVYSTSDMKRYLGALNETHNEHLKGIKEGFILINKKLDSHTEMIGVLMEDVSVMKTDLKRRVDYDEFLSLVRRVQKIESKI